MFARQPLPQPDGIVNDSGSVVEDSRNQAINIANNLNEGIKGNVDDFMLKAIKGGFEVTQDISQLTDENYKEALEHNKVNFEN